MSLEKLLGKEISKTAVSITRNKTKAIDYLIKYELGNYFDKSLSQERLENYRGLLEEKLNQTFEKYSDQLHGLVRKGVSKGSMLLGVANHIYGYMSKVPVAYVGGLNSALFLTKTLAEVPALVEYFKKSKDWYGLTSYTIAKTLRALTPIIGPALESGAFERMIMKGILRETKREFLKEINAYSPTKNYIRNKMRKPLSEVIEFPTPVPLAA